METIILQDPPPDGHELGGVEPAVHTLAQLETAVESIAWIESRRRTVLATHAQKVRFLEQDRDRELVIDVAGTPVTFDDREHALRQGVADYVHANRDEVFAPGSQTVRFAAGDVSLRKSKPRIDFADGATKTTVAKALIKRHGLVAKLAAYAARIKIAPFLRLKAELDVAGLKSAFEQGKVPRAALTREGLKYVDDEETVDVKTHDHKGRRFTPETDESAA